MTSDQDALPPEAIFTPEAVGAYVDAASGLAGFDLAPQYREGVIGNLRHILIQTVDLMALQLDWVDEAAPVFEP